MNIKQKSSRALLQFFRALSHFYFGLLKLLYAFQSCIVLLCSSGKWFPKCSVFQTHIIAFVGLHLRLAQVYIVCNTFDLNLPFPGQWFNFADCQQLKCRKGDFSRVYLHKELHIQTTSSTSRRKKNDKMVYLLERMLSHPSLKPLQDYYKAMKFLYAV